MQSPRFTKLAANQHLNKQRHHKQNSLQKIISVPMHTHLKKDTKLKCGWPQLFYWEVPLTVHPFLNYIRKELFLGKTTKGGDHIQSQHMTRHGGNHFFMGATTFSWVLFRKRAEGFYFSERDSFLKRGGGLFTIVAFNRGGASQRL